LSPFGRLKAGLQKSFSNFVEIWDLLRRALRGFLSRDDMTVLTILASNLSYPHSEIISPQVSFNSRSREGLPAFPQLNTNNIYRSRWKHYIFSPKNEFSNLPIG